MGNEVVINLYLLWIVPILWMVTVILLVMGTVPLGDLHKRITILIVGIIFLIISLFGTKMKIDYSRKI